MIAEANGHTVYHEGNWYRSSLEVKFTVLFDRLELAWFYEPFRISVGQWSYQPDFLIYLLEDAKFTCPAEADLEHAVGFCGFSDAIIVETKPQLEVERWKHLVQTRGVKLERDGEDWQFIKAHQIACRGYAVWYMAFDPYRPLSIQVMAPPMFEVCDLRDLLEERDLVGSDKEIYERAIASARRFRTGEKYGVSRAVE